jgi:hypothetical protein
MALGNEDGEGKGRTRPTLARRNGKSGSRHEWIIRGNQFQDDEWRSSPCPEDSESYPAAMKSVDCGTNKKMGKKSFNFFDWEVLQLLIYPRFSIISIIKTRAILCTAIELTKFLQ